MKRRHEITAVLDEELEPVLERLGLKAKLEEHALVCAVCGDAVSLNDIGAIYSRRGKPRVVCNKDECMVEFALGGKQ